MDERLIQVQAMATHAASVRMTAWQLRVPRDSAGQASCPLGGFPWDRRIAAYAGIFTLPADQTDDPVLPRCHRG